MPISRNVCKIYPLYQKVTTFLEMQNLKCHNHYK
jgi:hypothetical protein